MRQGPRSYRPPVGNMGQPVGNMGKGPRSYRLAVGNMRQGPSSYRPVGNMRQGPRSYTSPVGNLGQGPGPTDHELETWARDLVPTYHVLEAWTGQWRCTDHEVGNMDRSMALHRFLGPVHHLICTGL